MWDRWGGMGMGWGWLFGLLVLVGVVVLVVVLVRVLGSSATSSGGATGRTEHHPRHAEEILAERYARGEIDTSEYEERLRTLRGE